MDELVLRVLDGEPMCDVVACALLAGDGVELTELLARLDAELCLRHVATEPS